MSRPAGEKSIKWTDGMYEKAGKTRRHPCHCLNAKPRDDSALIDPETSVRRIHDHGSGLCVVFGSAGTHPRRLLDTDSIIGPTREYAGDLCTRVSRGGLPRRGNIPDPVRDLCRYRCMAARSISSRLQCRTEGSDQMIFAGCRWRGL